MNNQFVYLWVNLRLVGPLDQK